jgi:hypothetical protein
MRPGRAGLRSSGSQCRVAPRQSTVRVPSGDLARNVFTYDDLGNLLVEQQQHGGLVGTNSPAVGYGWAFADHDSGNYNRLTGSTYPVLGVGTPASVGFDYTGDAGVDNALSRVTALTGSVDAAYSYIGQARRTSTSLDDGAIVQSFGSGGTYAGLDRFGRVIDLNFAGADHQYQYGYDRSGNRAYAHVTQATLNGTPHDNDRSYWYAYDALQRLKHADLGRLDPGHEWVNDDPNVALCRRMGWGLDDLGNWTSRLDPGPFSRPGLVRSDDTNGDG